MGKIKEIRLSPMQQSALEDGYRNGSSHAFRMRCKAVLLKAQGLSPNRRALGNAPDNGQQLGEALRGRRHQRVGHPPGRGRKPIIGTQDEEIIRHAIEKDRSSILSAKAQWEAATGKTACEETLRRFLSALAQDLDA